VDLGVDEAVAAGALHVEFSKPVIHYVENFLNMPVGIPVPVGYYDFQKSGWVPADDGRVIKILWIASGFPALDIDGHGKAATAEQLAAIGFTREEADQLVRSYAPGTTLWRVPLRHFSPWDCNWPNVPDGGDPPPDDKQDPVPPEPTKQCGSIVECETRTLIE